MLTICSFFALSTSTALYGRCLKVNNYFRCHANFSTNCLPIWLKFSQCGQCSLCDRYRRCNTSHATSHITHHKCHKPLKTTVDPLCDTILEMSPPQHQHGTEIHITGHVICHITHHMSHITCHKCHKSENSHGPHV